MVDSTDPYRYTNMEDYVARLVAHIRSQPQGICTLGLLGSCVPKPPGVVGGLKSIVKGRQEFILHDPNKGGGGERVSLAQAPGTRSTGSATDTLTTAPAPAPALAPSPTQRYKDFLVCDLPHDHPELLSLIGEAAALRDKLGKNDKKRKTLNLIIHVRDTNPYKMGHNHFVTSTLATLRVAVVDAQKGCPPTGRSAEQAHLARGEAAVLRGQIPQKVGNLAGNIDSALRSDHALALKELHAVVHAEQDGLYSIAAGSVEPPITPEARQALNAEIRKINVSRESYFEPELRECDAQGFMAAEALLWSAADDGCIMILMAEVQLNGLQRITFLGGERNSLAESACQVAERKATEGTGGLLSRKTRAAILDARGPVLWDSKGKYATFVIETVEQDVHLPRRLAERNEPERMAVGWYSLSDVLSWQERGHGDSATLRLLRPHLHGDSASLRLLRPHLQNRMKDQARKAKVSDHAEKSPRSDLVEPLRASMSIAKEMAPFIASTGPEASSNPLQPALLKVFTDKEHRAPWGITQINVPCRAVLAQNVHTSHVAVSADLDLDSDKLLVVEPGETVQVGWAKRSDRVTGWDEDLSPVIDEGVWELFPRSPLDSPLSSSSPTRRRQDEVEMRLCAIPLVDVHREADGLHYLHDLRTMLLEVWELRLKPEFGCTYPGPRPAKYGGGTYLGAPLVGPMYSSEVEIARVQSAKLCSHEIAVSSRVHLSGLLSRPQLNGIKGTVVGKQGERWQVKLDTGEELALRSANLQAGSVEMLGLGAMIGGVSTAGQLDGRIPSATLYHVDATKKDGLTALMKAAQNGDKLCLRVLLEAKADPNQAKPDGWTDSGWTALMSAAQNGHERCVHVLLESGAFVDTPGPQEWTALVFASSNGHERCALALLKAKADPNKAMPDGATALILAAQNGHKQVALALLKAEADPNKAMPDGTTSLMRAAQNGHEPCLHVLLESGAVVDTPGPQEWTALMFASSHGHKQVALVLLEAGAVVSAQNNAGVTALMYAANKSHEQVALVLLKAKADPNQAKSDGWTALMFAAQNGHEQVALVLLEAKVDPNKALPDGWTALMWAGQNGHEQVALVLLNARAAIDQSEENGYTALMFAAQNGHEQAALVLLEAGAVVSAHNNAGVTALMYAANKGHEQVALVLLKANADPNKARSDGVTALMYAAQNGHKPCLLVLLEVGAAVDKTKVDGYTVLMFAAHNGHEPCVHVLLEAKADPNKAMHDGATALILAAQNGHEQVALVLLKAKVDPNKATSDGVTALMIAAQNGHKPCVRILLEAKADPKKATKRGMTALKIAEHPIFGNSTVANFLREHGAVSPSSAPAQPAPCMIL